MRRDDNGSLADIADLLGLSDAVLSDRRTAIGLTDEDRQSLREIWPRIERHTLAFIHRLYQRLRETPQLAGLLLQESRVERLITQQHKNLRELFCDPIDRAYVQQRLKIGVVHHRLRITPQWYLATYAIFMSEYVDILLRATPTPSDGLRIINALYRSLLFDATLILDAYGLAEEHSISQTRTVHDSTTARDPSPITGMAEDLTADNSRTGDLGITRIRLSDNEVTIRCIFIGIDASCTQQLRQLDRAIHTSMSSMLNKFYDFIRATPALNTLLHDDHIARLIPQVRSYWRELVEGRFDRSYAASRMRIGVLHEQIGLVPQWYLVGLCHQTSDLLMSLPADMPQLELVLKAFFKAIFFDLTFVIDAYMDAHAATLLHLKGYAHTLMSGLTAAVVVVDSHNRVQFANDAFVLLTGVDPALLFKMPITEAIASNDVHQCITQRHRDGLNRISCIGQIGNIPYRITAIELSGHVQPNRGATALVLDDISDVLRLSDSIEQDTHQFKRLADAVPAVLWEMDWQSRTIISISRATLELIGLRDITLLGRANAWIDAILPLDRERFAASCSAALETKSRTICEYRMRHAEGHEIWVRSDLVGADRVTSEHRLAAVTIDVTQQRRSESLRISALKHLSGSISHVINNGLTVIGGNIELHHAADHATRQGPMDEFLTAALAASQRAAGVVAKLLAFAGGRQMNPQSAELNSLIRTSQGELQLSAGPNLILVTELADDLAMCRVDPELFIESLGHLCENARQAMPFGGTLTIATRNIGHQDRQQNGSEAKTYAVEVSVTDHGPGMSEYVRTHAVEPFFSTTEVSVRLGLGLSMVHGFVSQSGGELQIESRHQQGTRIAMRFPPYIALPEIAPKSTGDLLEPTVLVVDSDEALRHFATNRILALGYHVISADSADHALQRMAEHPADLLLTDIHLGAGINGISLAVTLQSNFPELSVVLMTAVGAMMNQDQRLPPDWRILVKPFTTRQLDEAITAPLQRRATQIGHKALLSKREREVLHWIASGKSQMEAGAILGISERTIEQHIRSAKRKLKALNTVHTVVEAITKNEIHP